CASPRDYSNLFAYW
nr:immunoglobulin heavy chain junction region [Mus musculus]